MANFLIVCGFLGGVTAIELTHSLQSIFNGKYFHHWHLCYDGYMMAQVGLVWNITANPAFFTVVNFAY